MNNINSYGNNKVKITKVTMLNSHGINSEIFVSGEACTIVIHLHAHEDLNKPTIGILIRDRFGQDIFGTNTFHLNYDMRLARGQDYAIKYCFNELNIGYGKYTLTVAAHSDDTHLNDCYEWIDKIKAFEVVIGNSFQFIGIARLTPQVETETCATQQVPGAPI